MSGKYY